MPKISSCGIKEPEGIHTCMNCLKKEKSLLNELSFSELEFFENGRSTVEYQKGEIIFKEGEKPMGLLCLNAGKVKISRKAHNGTEQIVALKKPVDFIDLHTIINDKPYTTTASAIEDSSVCIIDKDSFLNVINHNPVLALKIMRSFAKQLDEADSRFLNMTQKHLRARLADALILLYEMYGTRPEDKTLNCTLKRAELAALSNMTTANVIRTLSDFEKEKLVVLNKKQIEIPDIELLKQVSKLV